MKFAVLLGLLVGCNMISKSPGGSSSTPASGGGEGQTASGGGGPAWQKASDDYANGLGVDGDGSAWDTSVTHKNVEKACGHHIHVNWDWPSFNGRSFSDYTPQGPGRMCIGEVLFRIAVMCGNEQKSSALLITTVTCHYKECTELPPSAWDRNDGILDPGDEFALSNNGTNLDVSFCEKSSTTGTYDLYRWMKNPHYPVVKKPGSVQRKD